MNSQFPFFRLLWIMLELQSAEGSSDTREMQSCSLLQAFKLPWLPIVDFSDLAGLVGVPPPPLYHFKVFILSEDTPFKIKTPSLIF